MGGGERRSGGGWDPSAAAAAPAARCGRCRSVVGIDFGSPSASEEYRATGVCEGCQDAVYVTRLGDAAVRGMIAAGTVNFYERGAPFYEFTNFAELEFTVEGSVWPTSEHYFQAQKFRDPALREHIRRLATPRDCFQAVRDPRFSPHVRADWEEAKVDVMVAAVRAKVTAHPRLQLLLNATGAALLMEHTTNDSCVRAPRAPLPAITRCGPWMGGGAGSGATVAARV